jgi:hypothetical protein
MSVGQFVIPKSSSAPERRGKRRSAGPELRVAGRVIAVAVVCTTTSWIVVEPEVASQLDHVATACWIAMLPARCPASAPLAPESGR